MISKIDNCYVLSQISLLIFVKFIKRLELNGTNEKVNLFLSSA
jgi:hypothetical protein